MRAGECAIKVGNSGDHRRPGLGRRVRIGPVVAAWMETEIGGSVQSRKCRVVANTFPRLCLKSAGTLRRAALPTLAILRALKMTVAHGVALGRVVAG